MCVEAQRAKLAYCVARSFQQERVDERVKLQVVQYWNLDLACQLTKTKSTTY